jgi:probable DNA metabolism protein
MSEAQATVAYDGSFPGFLCACAEALNAREPIPRPVRESETPTLFEIRTTVKRDDQRAAALWVRLSRRIADEPRRRLLEAFLSDVPGIDAAIAATMRRMWRAGDCRSLDLSDPDALMVEKAAYRAREEGHKVCGLVRFSELSDGSWYAPIEPCCDILGLIGDHFARRFAPMRFAIHDTCRRTAIMHEPGRLWNVIDGFNLELPDPGMDGHATLDAHLAVREREIRAMWRLYFETIAIQPRKNARLQRSKVPQRYWSRLTELSTPVEGTHRSGNVDPGISRAGPGSQTQAMIPFTRSTSEGNRSAGTPEPPFTLKTM